MKKMEQFPAKNPNPVLSIEKGGTVLYSNAASEPLLYEWGVGIGDKLPFYIGDFVKRIFSRNSVEKMEIKVSKLNQVISQRVLTRRIMRKHLWIRYKELERNNLRNAFFNSNEIREQSMESFKYSVKIESSYFAAGTKDNDQTNSN